jgi:dolichol-phosphate mannosyltransferase
MRSSADFFYDLHGIISVHSDVALPELEVFRIGIAIGHPAVRVRIGKPNGTTKNEFTSIAYHDGIGRLGFALEMIRGETVEIIASPLLRRSPHVLYTNAVEPLLRWMFVERGFALVHGACVANGDDAYLITARTDTGKTTTILRLLDHEPTWDFLSDDLTLLAPDGRVMMYPKPLTISKHTLSSVRSASLSRRERFFLPLQSRLHSRSGRRFGLLLAKTRLPMATTNAITQMIVPPPKYAVTRLVPGTRVICEAKLAGLVVIERGHDAEYSMSPGEAINVLMANCEDAYGFPPYASIKSFLYGGSSTDLRPAERATVASALNGLPAVTLRSSTRDWWQRLPDLSDGGFARLAPPVAPASRITTSTPFVAVAGASALE